MTYKDAIMALDKIIKKSRVHLYKPIQVAEILFRDRTFQDIDLEKLESYRNPSKKWRDEICIKFLGRISTSSQKFQDNLFESNATPPSVLAALGIRNRETEGEIEAYVYHHLRAKHFQMSQALSFCTKSTPSEFRLEAFLNLFRYEPGLKRSIDKIYEIVVYALFSVLVEEINVRITVSTDEKKQDILKEFDDFAEKVICISSKKSTFTAPARLYRVGVTNAADRGLDMWANFGPAVQIKHLSLDLEAAENIINCVTSDRVVIVCKAAEKATITSLLSQIGWMARVQSLITEDDLLAWYEKGLRGQFANRIGQKLLDCLEEEIKAEFPATNSDEFEKFYAERGYHKFNF